jgi:AcrR family transcriptional regulator
MKEIAASTTATGREMLQFSKYFIENIFTTMINLAKSSKKKFLAFAESIYKYFPTKELLFSEAISEIYQGWIIWAYNGAPLGGSLETTLDTGRKLFWVKQSHPLFAKILHNTLRDPSFVIASVKIGAEAVFRNYANLGILEKEDFDKRFILWSYCYAGILTSVHLTEELSPTQAEESLGIALSIWGISEAKAKKLISRPLVFAPVK